MYSLTDTPEWTVIIHSWVNCTHSQASKLYNTYSQVSELCSLKAEWTVSTNGGSCIWVNSLHLHLKELYSFTSEGTVLIYMWRNCIYLHVKELYSFTSEWTVYLPLKEPYSFTSEGTVLIYIWRNRTHLHLTEPYSFTSEWTVLIYT